MRFRLAINPCPASLSYQTLHNILKPSIWKKLRSLHNPRCCEICGWQKIGKKSGYDLRLHEAFDYKIMSMGESIAYLRRLQFLCNRCHGIVHNGQLTAKIIREMEFLAPSATRLKAEIETGLLRQESTVAHFCRVNQCRRDAFFCHAEWAVQKKAERDQRTWRIDWTKFDPKDVEEALLKHA